MQGFNMDVKEDKLALYDKETYAECTFNHVRENVGALWGRVGGTLGGDSNSMMVYIEQSAIERNIFVKEGVLDKHMKADKREATEGNTPFIQNTRGWWRGQPG